MSDENVKNHCQYCAAINCANSRIKNPGLVFFTFPKGAEKRSKEKAVER